MTDVLGTPVEVAADDDRARTLLVSDLHVPMQGGRVLEDLRRLLAEARREAGATRLLVLGDLLEYLVGPRQLAVGAYRDVVAALRAAAEAGVSITVLRGNRDFMMDGEFARAAGVRLARGGVLLELGGRRCVAVHGDELCVRDLPYQRSKRILRSRVVRGLLRHVPLSVALWLARRVRRASERSVRRGDPSRFLPPETAVREALAAADLVVFGHIHRPGRGLIPGAGEYCVLPAFDETGVFLEQRGRRLRYRSLDGGVLEDYPPHAFPADPDPRPAGGATIAGDV